MCLKDLAVSSGGLGKPRLKGEQETVEACSGGSPHAARSLFGKKGLSVGVGCIDFYLVLPSLVPGFLCCSVIVSHRTASALSVHPVPPYRGYLTLGTASRHPGVFRQRDLLIVLPISPWSLA